MPIDRTTVIKGPAKITYNSQTFFTKGDITLNVSLNTMPIESSAHGKLDERVIGRTVEVSFTPVGEWEALAVLWPYNATTLGTSIFATEYALVIHTVAGTIITFPCAAITKIPDIDLSAAKTAIGQVTFTAITKNSGSWATEADLYTITSGAFSGWDALSIAAVKTSNYGAVWGARGAPWDDIKTVDGWRIGFDLKLEPISTDDDDVFDMVFAELNVTARCRPLGITEAEMLTELGIGSFSRGHSLSTLADGDDLVITGAVAGDPLITLTNCALRNTPMAFGPATLRHGEVLFVANREFSGGLPVALCTIDTYSP